VITITEFWQKLSNKKYRSAFAREQFKRLVPLQVQTLRKQREWSQEYLAERAKLTQGVISRAEDQDYGNLTVNTILSIAEGFDVAFVGRFVPFSELDRWYVSLSQETMRVPGFDAENAAMVAAEDASNAMTAARGNGLGDARYGNVIVFDEARKELAGNTQSFSDCLGRELLTATRYGGSTYAAVGGATR
jgi:transcriptional regulator with XRE-family HTH domain